MQYFNTKWMVCVQLVMSQVVVPELAMLRFAVYEDGSKLLGQRVLPLPCIQAGMFCVWDH